MVYRKSGLKKNYSKMAKKAISKKSNGVKTNKSVVNPIVKSYVSKMIKKTEEVKCNNMEVAYRASIFGSGFDVAAIPAYGYTSNNTIVPLISQGTGSGERVGNKIKPVSCFIRGYIRALPISATGGNNAWPNEPFYVRLVLFCPKANMSTNVNSDIMDNNNTNLPFQGTLDSMLIPYNKDKFKIGFSRTFKLQAPVGTAGTLSNSDIGGLPVARLFKIRVPLPKTLTYVDTQTAPSNVRWYLSAGVVNTSGNIAAAADIRCNLTAETILYYTDA